MTIVGTASVRISAITSGFETQLKTAVKKVEALTNAGGKRGSLKDLFELPPPTTFKKIGTEADSVYQSFNDLLITSYKLQGAIAGVVPVIGQLAAGLFALGSQAAAAGPSLIVLPGILSSLMQAGITAKLALGGVFKAVGELGKQKTGSVDRMPAKLAAIANAQERLRSAQEGLNRAYKEAAERLQQLGFDSEDAAIAQEKAAIALEDARNTLARVQDLPPNSRARKEAELAFKEADLNYRRAIDRSNDLADEQDRVTKGGKLDAKQQVEQSDEVVKAKREVEKATRELAKAQKDLTASSSSGLTEFKKLSKSAQEFAKYLVSLKPEINKLKDAAGAELFKPLQGAIQNLVDNFLPRLQPLLRATGAALGKTASDFSKVVTEAKNLASFEKIGKTNVYVTERFGKVLGNLYTIIVQVLDAAGPLIKRFADWVVTLTGGWAESRKVANETGKLTKMFEYAGDVASQLGDIIGNLIGGLFNMGKAAAGPGSGGEMIFKSLEKSTKKFKDWSKAVLEDGSLAEYFKHASTGFMKIAGIIGKIFKIIFKSATADENFEFLDSISRAVDNLGEAFGKIVESGPSFGKAIEGVSKIINVTSESGSIKTFFTILTKAMDGFVKLMENDVVQSVFKFLAAWHAARLAFGVIRKVIGFALKYFLGFLRQMWSTMKAVWGVMQTLTGGSAVMSAAILAIVAVIILAFKNSEKFRKSLGDLVGQVFNKLASAVGEVKDAFTSLFGGVGSGKFFKTIGDFLAVTLVPLLRVVLIGAIDLVKNGIIGLMKVVRGIIDIFAGFGVVIRAIFKLFTGDFSGAWEDLKSGVSKIFGGLITTIKGIFQGFISWLLAAFPPLIVPFMAIKVVIWAIGNALKLVWKKVIEPVFGFFADKVGTVVKKFEPITRVLTFIAKLIRNVFLIAFLIVFTTIGIIIAEMWRKLKKLASIIADKLGGSFKTLKTIATTVFAVIGGVVLVAYGLMKGAAKATFAFLKKSFENIVPIARKVFGFILEFWKTVFKGVKWAFENVWPKIWGAIQWAWDNVIKKAFSLILAYWKFVIKAVKWAFENVWPKIWGAIQWAWDNVFKKIFGLIGWFFKKEIEGWKIIFEKVWPVIWGAISWAWDNVIKPVFKKIFEAFQFYWGLIKAAFDLVWPYIWTGIQWAWNNVIKPTFELLGSIFSAVWNGIKAAFDFVWPYISGAISWAWENVIKPVFDLLGSVFSAAWDKIKAAFDVVWPVIWGAISWAWDNVIKPVFGKISSVFKTVWDGVKEAFTNVWDNIKLAFTNFPQFIKNIFNGVIKIFNGLFNGIVEGFKQIPTLIGKIWDGVVGLFRSGINLIIKGFNNTLGGKKFTLPGFLGGGTFGFDKIKELGSGEKNDPEKIITGGYHDIPSLARGGTVLPRAGGTLVRVAEAGRPERVEPLDSDGLSKRDKAMIAALSGGLAGASINVYPSAKMDEVELAALVNRQIAFQLRKGAA